MRLRTWICSFTGGTRSYYPPPPINSGEDRLNAFFSGIAEKINADNFFFGLGPEINGYTRHGAAFGGNLNFGADFLSMFGAGLGFSFYHDAVLISAFETNAFFRYYLPWFRAPKENDALFAQTELGFALISEDGRSFPAFSGGLALGWRFNIPKTLFGQRFYVEPAVRLGTPYIWGFGVTAGIRLGNRAAQKKTETRETVIETRETVPTPQIPVPETREVVTETTEETAEEPQAATEIREETETNEAAGTGEITEAEEAAATEEIISDEEEEEENDE